MPSLIPFAHRRANRARAACQRLAMLCVALPLAACEIPTAIPQVDERFIAPPQTTTIAVASLLPPGVRVAPDSAAFLVDLASASVARPLSADCPACAAANGTTVPKPAFVAALTVSSSLPADIVSAQLVSGALQLVVQNNYTFDPLRPSPAARGSVVVTVMNGSVVLGRDSVNGATTALPAGGSLARNIALSGTITGATPVTIILTLNSPAGDPVLMDAGRTLVVSATPANLRVASAGVRVVGRQVSSTLQFDLGRIDAAITTRVTGGALLLDVANPFAVSGTIAVQFAGPGIATFSKSVALGTGTTRPVIALTQAELQSLFGHVVTVTLAGVVNGSSGAVTVAPRQAVLVTSRLDFTLHTGG